MIIHTISDSHSSVVKDSSPLRCYNVILDCLALHDEGMITLQKHQELFTQQCSVTSQKTCVLQLIRSEVNTQRNTTAWHCFGLLSYTSSSNIPQLHAVFCNVSISKHEELCNSSPGSGICRKPDNQRVNHHSCHYHMPVVQFQSCSSNMLHQLILYCRINMIKHCKVS